MLRQTATFTARDARGRRYEISVFQESADTVTSAGGHTAPDEKRMTTSDGLHVNWKGKGRYEIVAADENVAVTSTDAAAP